MKKLKIILLFSILIIRIVLISNYKSIYSDYVEIVGTIYKIDNNYIYLKTDENIIVKTTNLYEVGDIVKVSGKISKIDNVRVFNLFNYKKYLLSKKIYSKMTPDKIEIVGYNNNLLYKIRKKINNRLNIINNPYLDTFILAENEIDDEIYDSYKVNGITHLFAISGMHIGIFSTILLFIFNKIFKNRKYSYLFTSIILIIYMLIINTSSIIRSVCLFIGCTINKIFNLKIKTIDILQLILYVLLVINPYYIYDVGFLYSFTISYFLIKYNRIFINKNYIIKLIYISTISVLVSFPITINNNFNINLLSPIANLIFVPLISIIIFPFSLLVMIIPKLNGILLLLINILENISVLLSKIKLIIYFPYMNFYLIIIYYIIIHYLFKKFKIYKMFIYLVFLLLLYNIYLVNFNFKMTMIDVSQGDSLLLELKNKNVLIDTGGSINNNYTNNRIIPYLHSLGIKKINYLIISHGDFDHMGEAINLVNNFKVENVIFNCGEYNELEQELIKVLDKKKIKYYSCIKELNIDKYRLQFLNTKEYDNENENSNVIYFDYNNYKFLFMGDAGVEKEKDILDKYNLNNIDFLKVGHHGSNTSSSEYFISSIMPKYSLISVGAHNRYGHPKDEVLETLNNSKIYRTDLDGSIEIKLNKNGYKIRTCPP